MNPPPPAARPSPAFLASGLGDRILLGALAALIVARPLVHGDDPGRLRLTTPGGALSFNLCVWLVVLGLTAWRFVSVRGTSGGGLFGIALMALCLSNVGIYENAYKRPATLIVWEFLALIAAFVIAVQLGQRAADRRGLMNVLLASAVSVAAIGIVQRLGPILGMPSTEPVITDTRPGLAGDDEFQPQLNSATTSVGLVHGTLESPETYLVFLLLSLPSALLMARASGSRFKVVLPVLLICGVLAVFVGSPFSNNTPTSLSEGVRILRESSSWGCGPGNFSRAATDGSVASGSAWLTLMATFGVVAALIIFGGCGVFLLLAAWVVGSRRTIETQRESEEPAAGTRWEFYLGGIAGLLAGFIWAVGQMAAESPVWEVYKIGGYAIGRGIIWLAAFGTLERLRPNPMSLRRAMLWGFGVVILAGFFTEAALSPAVLFPAAVVMGTVLAMRFSQTSAVADEKPWSRPLAVAATVLMATAIVYFVLTVTAPGWQTADAVRKARMASRLYPDVERQIDLAKNNVERANARTKAVNFLNGQILNPLRAAAVRDPQNAALLLEIARWERPLWRQLLYVDPSEAAVLGRDILKRADQAAKLDPKNVAGQQAILEALFLYRKESNSKPVERLEAFNNHLAVVAQRMPHLEVPYRFRMVMTLLKAGDADGVEPEIAKLLRLNRVDGQPHGGLTDAQRQEVIDTAKAVVKDPPQELLDEWTR